jgi:hypothetical protein
MCSVTRTPFDDARQESLFGDSAPFARYVTSR